MKTRRRPTHLLEVCAKDHHEVAQHGRHGRVLLVLEHGRARVGLHVGDRLRERRVMQRWRRVA
jgi:hypothetical protein